VKVHLAKVVTGQGEAGEVLDSHLTIACGEDALQLLSVQPAGKSRMNVEDFLRGTNVPVGSKLD
jgi:methionyl-tRNA formyltransferase